MEDMMDRVNDFNDIIGRTYETQDSYVDESDLEAELQLLGTQ